MSVTANNPDLHIDLIDPGIYLKAADLRGKIVVLTIKNARVEEMENDKEEMEEKLILSFEETDREFVAGKTNRIAFSKVCGEKKARLWIGKKISLAPHIINAFGDPNTECIRVVNGEGKVFYKSRKVKKWVTRKWNQ